MSTSSILILAHPRSGTTLLQNLLSCHYQIISLEEPLNDEFGSSVHPLEHIDNLIRNAQKPITCIKCFPEQLIEHNVRLDDLIRHIRCSTVVVIWRRSVLEMFVSRKLAYMTGKWYSKTAPTEILRINVEKQEFLEFAEQLEQEWLIMGNQWPIEVAPFFVTFEDIAENGASVAASILSNISLEVDDVEFKIHSKRQNPWPLDEKISNWHELPDYMKTYSFDVPKMLSHAIVNSIPISPHVRHLLPDREPRIPVNGWLYRVAEPYLPVQASRNVIDALGGRCISSAGFWPKELSRRLQSLFDRPVAQPCANGFAALVLALQAADVCTGDEVIIPAFTMIAVPNSVHFVGATAVLVDNAASQYNPGVKQIQQAASDKTKAVIVTHTYGVPMHEIEKLAELCRERKWTLIEDIAESVGVREKETGKLLGTFGDFACASMYANKILHSGDGGFVIAADPKYDGKLSSLVNHGFTRSFHFLHLEPAMNFKIHGLGAAIACGVLDRLEHILAHRVSVAQRYQERLSATKLRLMPQCGQKNTPWVFGVVCEAKPLRNALRRHLAMHGVETRDYFLPIHLQPASEKMNAPEIRRNMKLPVAQKLGSTGFYLPLFTDLSLDDVDYICDAVLSFFDPRHPIRQAPKKEKAVSVRVRPGRYALEAIEYDRSGRSERPHRYDHPLIRAVLLNVRFEHYLMQECWDDRNALMADIRACLNEAHALGLNLDNAFSSILEYCEMQWHLEPDNRRFWLAQSLDDAGVDVASIPTTTDAETRQFLVWVIEKINAKRVLELGSWLGRTTRLFGAAVMRNERKSPDNRKPIVYVLDNFQWQQWMNAFLPDADIRVGKSFFPKFIENVRPYLGDLVQAKQWNVANLVTANNGIIPENLQFDLVSFDFTDKADELENAWSLVKIHCIPNQTILVFNCGPAQAPQIVPFFTNHRHELKPIIYKPHTAARSFLFISSDHSEIEGPSGDGMPILKRKLKFLKSPDWQHHHAQAFTTVMSLLRDQYHDENAQAAFIPAVEDYLCDNVDKQINTPWIGIVHEIPHEPDQFYYPDLHRLCTREVYRPCLAKCRGLFTLTQYQAKYLRENLPNDLAIPVCPLKYPSVDMNSHTCKQTELSLWNGKGPVNLVFIGSFARDVDLFYNAIVPSNVKKVLLASDDELKKWALKAPKDIAILGRLDENGYEDLLRTSIAFLSLTADGAANTLVIECIARGTPILAPAWSDSCREYLGDQYPLFYEQSPTGDPMDLTSKITPDNIHTAISYLSQMDKTKFTIDHFCTSIAKSAVMRNVVPSIQNHHLGSSCVMEEDMFPIFDVTICVCSYKRTHHLEELLNRLWHGQESPVSMQIVVWNNNVSRHATVQSICSKYMAESTPTKRIELIQSTQNYYCMIRTCAPVFMRSDKLLICDDDIIPEPNFIRFFLEASDKYPEDVLCIRGHKFLEHELDLERPEAEWIDYDHVRFVDDHQPMQMVHFAHADACLVPKAALHELASVEMADPSFALVDDYWMSYILNSKFDRNIRKLCAATANGTQPLKRAEDSDTKGLAMHTRPEVMDARIRLYMHHMLRGWPKWPKLPGLNQLSMDLVNGLKERKMSAWKGTFVGFNVSSKLTDADVEDLVNLGVKNVRIGAVGAKKEKGYEFSGFNTHPQRQIMDLMTTIDLLAKKGINVVITLMPRIDLADAWSLIAKHCCVRENVIAYDLINEPFSDHDDEFGYWQYLENPEDNEGGAKLCDTYLQLIKVINEIDSITPIMLEPLFWAHALALPHLDTVIKLLDPETYSRLLLSFHFYEPNFYTQRRLNDGRYKYPGQIPLCDSKYGHTIQLNCDWIKERLEVASKWASDKSFAKIVIGEVGIGRQIPGARDYLKDVMAAACELGLALFIFSFRDADWEAMNYELNIIDDEGGCKSEFMPMIKLAIERAGSA